MTTCHNLDRNRTVAPLIDELLFELRTSPDPKAFLAQHAGRIADAYGGRPLVTASCGKISAVYVAAPWEDVLYAEAVEKLLAELGIEPTSRVWTSAARAATSEALAQPGNVPSDVRLARAARTDNRTALRNSDAVIVLARAGAGGEMFAEVEYAIERGKMILWCGERKILSTYAYGVLEMPSVSAACFWCRAYGAEGRKIGHNLDELDAHHRRGLDMTDDERDAIGRADRADRGGRRGAP